MEPWGRVVVQRGCAVQHPRAGLLPGAEAALPAVPGPALPPAGALRLLPSIGCVYHHPRESGCFAPTLYQVSNNIWAS